MRQIAQNYRSGELQVLEVPAPACRPGGVLVHSLYSLISTGTELMKVHEAGLSLAAKARARPDQVRKVLDSVAQQGPRAAYQKAVQRLDSLTPLGYSVSGIVSQVGEGVAEFVTGQVVACAGNEHALHAELNWVPTNLCVPVPSGVDPLQAAFATVGAVALHGVRRSEAQLGETACVIGLGLVGQLVVQLLVASGVRVVGVDTVEARCRLAERSGALVCAPGSPEGLERLATVIAEASGGIGADHVFLVAGGSSNAPAEAAAYLARDRGRVTDVGKCRLDLPWNAYYDKELEVRFSRSYGPGRYDDRYELDGIDYPPAYVRWTERRNLACFLDLLAGGAVDVDRLVAEVHPFEDAPELYRRLATGVPDGVGFLFQYPVPTALEVRQSPAPLAVVPSTDSAASSPAAGADTSGPRAATGTSAGAAERQVRLGFIGAGNYASSMLLPWLAAQDGLELRHVATTRPLTAADAQRRFGFHFVSTDAEAVLSDEDLDAVFIVTRHHTHASLVCRALERGLAVFVEKPLALTAEELALVAETADRCANDRLVVGFNRRFAPLLVDMRARFSGDPRASTARYAVSAGALPARSWYADEDKEGSRFVGEGGHFIDTLSWWLGARPVEVFAMAGRDHADVQASIRFDNGSVAALSYVTGGNGRYPKEVFEAAGGGESARLDNFRRATVWRGRRRRVARARGRVDKGQRTLLDGFVDAVRSGGPMPIDLPSLIATTGATLAADRSRISGHPEPV